ncbi:translation initiation factor IF-2-like [Leopardus geoffroyi]|uniref:translation initiation factor IF-2-like n=1 Tax=Leopardus geoffroyi TaxID=46844 RepID=UPI001E265F9E|nr:translation initiation factor IF-2-like [Leopardus geoffroyi]
MGQPIGMRVASAKASPPPAPQHLSRVARMLMEKGISESRPASVDGFSCGNLSPGGPRVARAGTRPRAPPRPAAAGAAAGTKAARVWAGRRAGSALGPTPGAPPPTPGPAPSSAARGAQDSHAAGLLLARRRRAGGERCGRGGPRGGAGLAPRVPAATARVRVLQGARRVEALGIAAASLSAPRPAVAEDRGGPGIPGQSRPARRVGRARAPPTRRPRRSAPGRERERGGGGGGEGGRRGAGPRRLQNLGQKLRSRRRRRRARAPPSRAERGGPRARAAARIAEGGRGAQEPLPAGSEGAARAPGSAPASCPGPPRAR